ncbi:MAG: TerB family tellurite resistance protein [Hyphomicrobiaceae bacterium]
MPWWIIKEALGLAEGGALRTAIGGLTAQIGLDRLFAPTPINRSVAFTMAVIALSAKLSKADGVSVRIEAEAFETIYHVPHDELPNVKRLFDLAKQDVAGFETYAAQVAAMLRDEPDLMRDVFEGLYHIASADGVIHEAEEDYLHRVATVFGLTEPEYRRVRALFVRDAADPYVVLGLPHDATDAEVKAQYRALVRQHHPDTLMAHGVPPEFIDQATRKVAAINVAYDAIARERGL